MLYAIIYVETSLEIEKNVNSDGSGWTTELFYCFCILFFKYSLKAGTYNHKKLNGGSLQREDGGWGP